MMQTDSDLTRTLASASAFGLVFALWCVGLLLWWRRRQGQQTKVLERLDEAGSSTTSTRTLRLWHDGREATTVVRSDSEKPTLSERLEQMRLDAGLRTTLRTLLLELLLASAVLAFGLVFVTGRVIPALVAVTAVLIVAWAWVSQRANKRVQTFERQFVDALELCARALRAGHPLLASFQLIGEEIPAPVGGIFKEICQQQSMGMRMDEALRRTAMLTRNSDMQLFSASLAIHMRTGGNLADVMQSLAIVIRERMRLGRRFRVLIAQTQISKRILIGMPFIMFALLNLIGPEYMDPMYASDTGVLLLAIAAVGLLIGWAFMNRMSEMRA